MEFVTNLLEIVYLVILVIMDLIVWLVPVLMDTAIKVYLVLGSVWVVFLHETISVIIVMKLVLVKMDHVVKWEIVLIVMLDG